MTNKREDTSPAAPTSAGKANAGKTGARKAGASQVAAPLASEDQVALFLRQNPDFLLRNSDLLDRLNLPERSLGKDVIDLQAVMMDRLRHQVADANENRDSLLETGRSNQAIQARIHSALLSLLDARNLEQLVETITTDLAVMLDIDVVTLCIEQDAKKPSAAPIRGIMYVQPGSVAALMGGAQVRLREVSDHEEALFGQAAPLVASDALLHLEIGGDTPDALLTLGSRKDSYFQHGQGTEMLAFLASAIARIIRLWLKTLR